jgi:hypothetical protein
MFVTTRVTVVLAIGRMMRRIAETKLILVKKAACVAAIGVSDLFFDGRKFGGLSR